MEPLSPLFTAAIWRPGDQLRTRFTAPAAMSAAPGIQRPGIEVPKPTASSAIPTANIAFSLTERSISKPRQFNHKQVAGAAKDEEENRIAFVIYKASCGCKMDYHSGDGMYSEVHYIAPCPKHGSLLRSAWLAITWLFWARRFSGNLKTSALIAAPCRSGRPCTSGVGS